MKFTRYILFCLIISYTLVPLLISQDLMLPVLQGYKKLTSYPVYTQENLRDFINGAADAYLAYGFDNLHVAEYKKGRNIIKLEIYKHSNSTQAFGIYSSERSSSAFRYLNIGSQGYISGGILNFCKGSYYVKIGTNSKSEKVYRSIQTLGLKVADMLPGESALPPMLREFPENGLLRNEEYYINEAVLGHEFLKDAFKASYEVGDIRFSIYIIERKSTEETRKIVTEYLEKTGSELDDPSGGKYIIRDGYNGDIFLSWKENRIVVISGLSKDQTELADRYTSEILK